MKKEPPYPCDRGAPGTRFLDFRPQGNGGHAAPGVSGPGIESPIGRDVSAPTQLGRHDFRLGFVPGLSIASIAFVRSAPSVGE